MEMYGGSILAMAGRDAIVLVTDQRFGRGLGLINAGTARPVWNDFLSNNAGTGNANVAAARGSCSSPWLLTATGLPGDVQSLRDDVQATLQREHCQKVPSLVLAAAAKTPMTTGSVSTRAAVSLVSHLLYQRRCYLVEPLLVGFGREEEESHPKLKPMLCTMDMLGATSWTNDYTCVGGAATGLWGSAAQHWKPQLETTALVQVALRAFFAAVDRDIHSGYGARVHILHQTGKWEELQVASRND